GALVGNAVTEVWGRQLGVGPGQFRHRVPEAHVPAPVHLHRGDLDVVVARDRVGGGVGATGGTLAVQQVLHQIVPERQLAGIEAEADGATGEGHGGDVLAVAHVGARGRHIGELH